MSEDFKRKIAAHIAKHGPYDVSKTLLGGPVDQNRRTIYDLRTQEKVETFNQEMKEWTPAMEAALNERLKELNAPFLPAMRAMG